MKKFFCLCLSILITVLISITAVAIEPESKIKREVITYDSGDCLIIETQMSDGVYPFNVERSSRSSSKTARYKN